MSCVNSGGGGGGHTSHKICLVIKVKSMFFLFKWDNNNCCLIWREKNVAMQIFQFDFNKFYIVIACCQDI